MSVPQLEISKSVVCYSLMIWFFFSSTEFGLQGALNSFADACDTAGMKISTGKLKYFVYQETLISACCK